MYVKYLSNLLLSSNHKFIPQKFNVILLDMECDELKRRLSANIKKIRKSKNLSQFDLAEKANLSNQTINSIEGKRLWPSDKTMVKIANALETDASIFFLPENYAENAAPNSIVIPGLRDALKKNVDYLIEEFFKPYI